MKEIAVSISLSLAFHRITIISCLTGLRVGQLAIGQSARHLHNKHRANQFFAHNPRVSREKNSPHTHTHTRKHTFFFPLWQVSLLFNQVELCSACRHVRLFGENSKKEVKLAAVITVATRRTRAEQLDERRGVRQLPAISWFVHQLSHRRAMFPRPVDSTAYFSLGVTSVQRTARGGHHQVWKYGGSIWSD